MNRTLLTVGLTGVGAALALGATVAPAQASPTASSSALPNVLAASTSVGGPCSGYANASWNRGSNVVTINDEAHSSYAFAACRLKVTLTWSAGGYSVTQLVHNIPTACALTDPTCPSTVYENGWTQSNVVVPFAVPFVDTLTAKISAR